MPTLNRRIEALEAKTDVTEENRVFLVRLVGIGCEVEPLTEITHNGQTWNIEPGETEDAFTERVRADIGERRVILIVG
jgi:hypothetical protein